MGVGKREIVSGLDHPQEKKGKWKNLEGFFTKEWETRIEKEGKGLETTSSNRGKRKYLGKAVSLLLEENYQEGGRGLHLQKRKKEVTNQREKRQGIRLGYGNMKAA